MDIVKIILPLILGVAAASAMKYVFIFFNVEKPKSVSNLPIYELMMGLLWAWAFVKLPLFEAGLFSIITLIISVIAWIDLKSFKIPLLLIALSGLILFGAILVGQIPLSSALWGLGIGAIIPWVIMVVTSLFTKRDGMGIGDFQLGFILGIWLGPVRMALTLFTASLFSLLTWTFISLSLGFDKDRALPFAPFLVFAGLDIYIASYYYPKFFHHLMI
ncbi:MAG: prepilin peptidase [Candidatus Marinimicrobia bacterium]|nr:prepilin peptidase [Candidatus Neomarinimicrobiota bacterium]